MNSLDSKKVVDTIVILHKRISERFPKSGLSHICLELHTIAQESKSRCEWIKKPQIILRIGISVVITFIIFILIAGVGSVVNFSSIRGIEFVDFLQVLDAGMNSVILIGAALLFVVTVEMRRKRKRAIKALHHLRVLAHVIDMHQLTKDPERLLPRGKWTPSSPHQTMSAFELTRYLNYCSEMFSLIGKIAALYAQDFEDTVVLTAVNDVETLTTSLSQKVWQKIIILHRFISLLKDK